jgi:hypothetical protein
MSEEKPNKDIVRSSAAEYLTFIAATGEDGVEVVYADENIWLSQKMMAALYDVNVRTVSDHLQKVFADNELEKDSVIRNFRITAEEWIEKTNAVGITAQKWKNQHPTLKGNQRDYATINQLICLSNMENLIAVFINENMPQAERLVKLNQIAIQQMNILQEVEKRKLLKENKND